MGKGEKTLSRKRESLQAHSITVDYREVKKFAVLEKAGVTRGCGGIVCMAGEVMPLDAQNCLIPCALL